MTGLILAKAGNRGQGQHPKDSANPERRSRNESRQGPLITAAFSGYNPLFDAIAMIERIVESVREKYLAGLTENVLTNAAAMSRHPRIYPIWGRLTRKYRGLGGIPCPVKWLKVKVRCRLTRKRSLVRIQSCLPFPAHFK